ncbi:MAG: N-acyl homoserine lactonase family protein [Bacillota bacterium]
MMTRDCQVGQRNVSVRARTTPVNVTVDLVCKGFPGKADISFLGWSNAALIRLGGYTMLFDTGAHAARPMLIDGLRRLCVMPEDVNVVFLSHLHFDHCGNALVFPRAEFIISREEWEYASTGNDLFVPREIVDLLGRKEVRLVSEGDSSIAPGVEVVFTPGHTPGSMALLIDTPEGPWVLAGDAVKNRMELSTGRVEMSLDPRASAESIAKIRALSRRVLPGHDCWLRVDGDAVIPEGVAMARVTLPQGMTGGAGGAFELVVDNEAITCS